MSADVGQLKSVLLNLHSNPSPPAEQPETCKKRASTALVIRVRPQFPQRSLYDSSKYSREPNAFPTSLDNFFEQQWVQNGQAEVLFIKRAVRSGDRWTGHVAFPGGKREAEDADDSVAAIRETQEEVGLDLDVEHCLLVSKLPERVITTNWGKIP